MGKETAPVEAELPATKEDSVPQEVKEDALHPAAADALAVSMDLGGAEDSTEGKKGTANVESAATQPEAKRGPEVKRSLEAP
jgi:hypothetical protein